METPLSTRRVTRSQTLDSASSNNTNLLFSKKSDESEMACTKSRQTSGKKADRSALIDITNDSPIAGLAMGNLKTPLSKKGRQWSRTPGSGEALLRGQVKSLLLKVEEDADLTKIALQSRALLSLTNSPTNLLAPTPVNTPQVSDGFPSVSPSPVTETFMISQIFDDKKHGGIESENVVITRSLLLDFYEKSDSSDCSSVVTYQGEFQGGIESSIEDSENSSIWSIQANASSNRDDYEDDQEDYVDKGLCYENEEEGFGESNDEDIDEICEGMMKISVVEAPKFAGKHIRFVYNSDDEVEGAEEDSSNGAADDGVMHLKGLPTPKGKHIRFPEE